MQRGPRRSEKIHPKGLVTADQRCSSGCTEAQSSFFPGWVAWLSARLHAESVITLFARIKRREPRRCCLAGALQAAMMGVPHHSGYER